MRSGPSSATRRRDVRVDDAAAGLDRIGGMLRRAIAFADSGGDAALCPHARRAFAERRRGNDRHRQRRKLQRREKSREAGADNDDVAGTRFAFEALELCSGATLRRCGHEIALLGM